MMNPIRVTIVLALLVLGLGTYILFVDIPKTRQFKKQETQEQQLLPFDDRAITQITWATPTETIILARDDKWRWTITEPMQSPADAREVRTILRALKIGKIKRIIENEPNTLDTYGLDPPYITLTLTTSTDTWEIALGDAGPFAPSLYVQTKSNDQVVLTTLDVMTFAKKSLVNFRLKDILLFDRDRVQEVQIQKGQTTMVMSRVAGAHSLTPKWMFKSPMTGPADKTAVGTLLMDLGGLTALGFVDGEEDKQRIFKQPPRINVSVKILEGTRHHQVNLYYFADAEKAYAITAPTSPWFEISPGILRPLTQGPFYFQDKRLFGMEVQDIAMLKVQTPDSDYTLISQHDVWVLEENPITELAQQFVKLFVSRVVDVPAEIQLPDSTNETIDHGLARPTATIYGINRRGEQKGRLQLGKRKKGLVYAKGAALPGLYQVRSTILNHIPTKTQLFLRKSLAP